MTTLGVQKMKVGKIKKLWAVLKICLENEIFDHLDLGRIKIWQNPEISVPFKIWIKIYIFDSGVTLLEGARGQGIVRCPID